MVQERQEPAEVGQLLDAGHKMPAGSLTRPREIFFKKCGGGVLTTVLRLCIFDSVQMCNTWFLDEKKVYSKVENLV